MVAVASLAGGPSQALAVDGYTLSITPPPSTALGRLRLGRRCGGMKPDKGK
jgi:hypothetical protein